MPLGVQGKPCRGGARKTCLTSGLNSWPPKQKLKGVSPPNFPSLQKFQLLEGIKKTQHRKQTKNHPTTGSAAPGASQDPGGELFLPLKMNSHSQRALCAPLLSAVQQSTPAKWVRLMSTHVPKLGQQDGASRGGLTRSAAEPLLTTFYPWGELIWVRLPATIYR